jgi:uncharacterized phage protein gp47/JayE
MPFGVTADGFSAKTREIIQNELESALQSAYGASIDLNPARPLGQLVGIWADQLALLWELAEASYNTFNPDAATGEALINLAALTGTLAQQATHSTVTLTLTGDDATTVPAGSQAAVDGTDKNFETLADATIAILDAWASGTLYSAGQRVSNDSPIRAYQCITTGTSAGSGGPTGTDDDITDNTAHWTYLGDGEGAVDANAQSVDTGPIAATSRTIIDITTPVAGWTGVINLLDATPGENADTDATLRERRENELSFGANAALEAIRVALLQLTGVTNVTMFENTSNVTDGDGMPPKSIEALVRGGADQDIWDTLFGVLHSDGTVAGAHAGGIETHGTESGTVTDSEGYDHTIKFTRPDEIEIWVEFDVTVDPDTFPTDGEAQIKAAIVAYGDALNTGVNVRASAVAAQCFKVIGVLAVPSSGWLVDDVNPPVANTDIVIAPRELATFDTSRITLNITEETP